MPTTTIQQEYRQPTCLLKVAGESATTSKDSASPAAIRRSLTCTLEIRQGEAYKTLTGDVVLLNDLVAVTQRYLSAQLRGQPQGTFSGTVAIRPLDFIFHRLTVRQGEGIGQVDLSMSQLFDLMEAVTALTLDMPQLTSLKPTLARPWYSQAPGIAALLVGSIGLAGAIAVLATQVNRSQPSESQTASSEVVEPAATPANPEALASTQAAPGNPALPETTDSSQELENKSGEAAPPAAVEPAPTQVDITASKSASTERDASLSPLAAQLQQTLQQQWQNQSADPQPLTYTVTVDAQGIPIVAVPQNETAASRKGETPLADVPEEVPTDLPREAETFQVTFAVDSSVQVLPQ
ncbi:MAG: DUF4335 domain-containing protein [Cyanobacteriota bacterium]|nr:DUF4335 domain-containing protein [Cyanobacteriota bacterium]